MVLSTISARVALACKKQGWEDKASRWGMGASNWPSLGTVFQDLI